MKKWIMIVLVFCFGFGELYSYSIEQIPAYYGFNSSFIYSDLMSNDKSKTENQINYGYGLHLEYFLGGYVFPHSSIKFGININNLGYEFEKENLHQNYELTYLSANVNYNRLFFDGQFYIIGGINLNYLYDVESEIETLNSNNERIEINRDLSGSEISNNYNRYDLMLSVGVGYNILMEGYYITIEPKYNFSFLNHISDNNQELKGMNFKNEFWSLNFGVSFLLYQRESRPYGLGLDLQD